MDTRWKGRLVIGVWALLFTLTASGIFSAFLLASNYSYRDYFHTDEFRYAVDEFTGYLGMFELYGLSMEEAEDEITVTDADIEEHRTRYGSLPEQVDNIKSQYEGVIQGAIDAGNKEAEQAFIKERDEKIADITLNFQSDEHVKPKVIKEKEAELKELFKLRENYRDEFNQYMKDFIYYFKNTSDGKVHTNIELKQGETAEDFFRGKEVQFTANSYVSSESFFFNLPYENDTLDSLLDSKGSFEGTVAVASDLTSSNSYYHESQVYKQKQMILAAHAAAGLAAFVLCVIITRRSTVLKAELGRWAPYYNKLPVDTRFLLLLLSAVGAVICLFGISDSLLYMLEMPYYRKELLVYICSCSLMGIGACSVAFSCGCAEGWKANP